MEQSADFAHDAIRCSYLVFPLESSILPIKEQESSTQNNDVMSEMKSMSIRTR